jgi:diacylglycerol kinase family enzyme
MQLGTFEQAPEVRCFCAEHVCIETKKRQSMTLAIDGEIVRTRSPLKFQVAQHALQVMVPQHAVTPI